jgi:uncharacterized protein YjiS (DUF1127 family)
MLCRQAMRGPIDPAPLFQAKGAFQMMQSRRQNRPPGHGGSGATEENSSYRPAFLHVLGTWLQRAGSRRALRELARFDGGRLADIGLTQADALREASKPFWRR